MACCRRRSTTRHRIPTAISTTCRTRRASRTSRRRCRTCSASAARTRRSRFASIHKYGGPDMAPQPPALGSAPAKPWRSSGMGLGPEMARMTALEAALGHRFAHSELLERALTHASYVNEHPPAVAQDGLAFVGDAALGLVVAERL